jgi:hypothetical protein
MVKRMFVFPILFASMIVGSLLAAGISAGALAQDENEPAQAPIASGETTSDETVQSTVGGEAIPAETEQEGLSKGAYWWVDLEPASIAALLDFGVDTLAFRYGTVQVNLHDPNGFRSSVSSFDAESMQVSFEWAEGGNPPDVSSLPTGLVYRPVIELNLPVGIRVSGNAQDEGTDFLGEEIIGPLTESNLDIGSIEFRMESADFYTLQAIFRELQKIRNSDAPFEIQLGIDARYIGMLESAISETGFADSVDGIVVYFLDYDFYGPSPSITDRRWIDETCAQLQSYDLPLTAVIPIYNRAIVYEPGKAAPKQILPALDLARLASVSEVTKLGVAGTEYLVNQPIGDSGISFESGYRIRLLESLKDVDVAALYEELPLIAPNLGEIDLFRFPLVPGFDPNPGDAIAAAGWTPAPLTEETVSPEDAGKKTLDDKYNKASQYIWMFALAMMFYLMIRMMRKPPESAGGKEGGSK